MSEGWNGGINFVVTARNARRQATGNSERSSTQMRLDVYVEDTEFAPRPQAFDVSVISPHSSSFRGSRPKKHIADKENEKHEHYKSLCEYYGIDLHAMVMDIYGLVGEGSHRGIQQFANFLASKTGTSPSAEKAKLLTRLTSLVLKYVATCINRRGLQAPPPLPVSI